MIFFFNYLDWLGFSGFIQSKIDCSFLLYIGNIGIANDRGDWAPTIIGPRV